MTSLLTTLPIRYSTKLIWAGAACFFSTAVMAAQAGPRVAVLAFTRAAEVTPADAQRLQDHLAATLSREGFEVITRDVAIDSLAASGAAAAEIAQNLRSGEAGAAAALETQLSQETSAARLAETLDAQAVVVAFIDSLGVDRRTFAGNERAPATGTTEFQNLRVSYRVCRAGDGVSLSGDSIKVSRTLVNSGAVQRATNDLLADMTEEAARLIARNVAASGLKSVTKTAADRVAVDIQVRVQLPGGATMQLPVYQESGVTMQPRLDVIAEISVDGVVAATSPARIEVTPGPHQIKVVAPGYRPWQRFVRCSAGQKLEIPLELSDEGYARWKDTIAFLQGLARKTQLDRADAERVRAEAEALRRANVEVRFDRLDANLDADLKADIDHTIRVNP